MPAKPSKAPAKVTKSTSSTAKAIKPAAPAAKKSPITAKKPVAKVQASPAKPAKPAAPVKAVKAVKVPKPLASASAKARPVLKTAPAAPAFLITRDMIATRAYYIGERRQAMGWTGDSSTDWIEAESQLIAEAKRKKST